MNQREFEHGFLQEDNSTTEDQPKKKHTAARLTSLTEGQEAHYDLESKVDDQKLQRCDYNTTNIM